MARGIWLRCLAILALGLILSAPSELWFYPVDLEPGLGVVVLAYGLCAWAVLSWLTVLQRLDPRGWWLGAGLFGFLIEGVVVPELYAVPVFNILWTSLAWHALLSVHLCLLWLRPRLDDPRRTLIWSAALGVGFGVWGAWFWNLEGAEAVFVWVSPAPYLIQVFTGWLLFAGGLAIWARVEAHLRHLSLRGDALILGLLAALVWAGSWALPFFPVSLTLPVLAVLSLWALRRGAPAKAVARHAPARPTAILCTAALPVAAGLTYLLMWQARIEWPANIAALIGLGAIALICWLAAFRKPT